MVPGFDAWGAITGVFGLLLLAFVRLLSERSLSGRSTGKHGSKNKREGGSRMGTANRGTHRGTVSVRSFKQYVAETFWAYGAGVTAAHWPP